MSAFSLSKLTDDAVASIIALPLTSGRYCQPMFGRLPRSVGAIGRKFQETLQASGWDKSAAYRAWRDVLAIAELEINAEEEASI